MSVNKFIAMNPRLTASFAGADGGKRTIYDIPVVISEFVPHIERVSRWEPTGFGPFAELEQSDESWARPLGLGRIVYDEMAVAYKINGDWMQEMQMEFDAEVMRKTWMDRVIPPPFYRGIFAGVTV